MLLKNKRILMFEDNLENIDVQQSLLQDEGAEVDLFVGGDLDTYFSQGQIDLIIMDLMIPGGVDGFDIRERIHDVSGAGNIPVVAVSAMDASLAVSRAKSLKFAGFIAKPIDMDLFPSQIASIMSGKSVWYTNN